MPFFEIGFTYLKLEEFLLNVKITKKDLEELDVPLISLGQQMKTIELIQKVEVICEGLKDQLDSRKKYIENLKRAILYSAFNGEL
ncbi:hypothetical protein KJ764_06025 [Patescibacteria group bacterium]|nr:hypothetical protein [Patescibacteria group bacterium]